MKILISSLFDCCFGNNFRQSSGLYPGFSLNLVKSTAKKHSGGAIACRNPSVVSASCVCSALRALVLQRQELISERHESMRFLRPEALVPIRKGTHF